MENKFESFQLTGGYTTNERELKLREPVHAVPIDSNQAVCGQKPTRISNGWVEAMTDGKYDKHARITCEHCAKKIGQSHHGRE